MGGDVERATRGVRKGLLCYVNRTKNCHRLSPHFRRGGRGRLVYHTPPNAIRVRYFEWDYLDFLLQSEAGPRECEGKLACENAVWLVVWV